MLSDEASGTNKSTQGDGSAIEMGQAGPRDNAFYGPLGLRAGWGIAIFVVFTLLLGAVLFLGAFEASGQLRSWQRESQAAQVARARHIPVPPMEAAPTPVFLSEMSEAGAVLLAALGVSFIERRRFSVYGLPLRRLRDLLPGAFWGLLCIAALIGLLRGLHLLIFDRQLLQGAAMVRYGLVWLVTFALVGVFEEFLFRGYIQFTLTRGLLGLGDRLSPAGARRVAFWTAALLWSTLFSLTHLANAGEDPFGLVMVFGAGVLFSYALWRTGSLWWGVGFHMTWDWGQSFLFGVPDSGNLSADRLFATHAVGQPLLSGAGTGPEGSVLVIPVLLLAALAVRWHRAEPQPPVEPERLPFRRVEVSQSRIP